MTSPPSSKSPATLTVEKLVPGGEGLSFLQGKAVFVPFAVPGETLRVHIVKEKKDYSRGEIESVLQPSPGRRKAKCSYYGRCGGCNWMHMEYREQLQQKKNLVREVFFRMLRWDLPSLEISHGPEFGYRNRVKFHRVGQSLGFKVRKRNQNLAIRACPILDPSLENLLKDPPPTAGRGTGKTLRAYGLDGKLSAGCPPYSEEIIRTSILGKIFQWDYRCFFQSNFSLVEALVSEVVSGVKGKTAVDFYSGVGLYSAFLADRFQKVLAVEGSPTAHTYAVKNLEGTEVECACLPVESFPLKLTNSPVDFLVANPPRTGLSPGAIDRILQLKPSNFCYVSCDPVTLARDLASFMENYTLERIRLFDFYPQTHHVETVIHLRRR